jgi:hypothetical protein
MNKNFLKLATAIVVLSSLAAPALAVNGGIGQTNGGTDVGCDYQIVCVNANGTIIGGSAGYTCNDGHAQAVRQCRKALGSNEGKASSPANASVARLHEPPVLRQHK